jgi:hypothetical protein
LASPLTFKTNKTMAIKKTTAVKKSDPPSKKKSGPPNRSLSPATNLIAGKDFGKLNRKTTDYYYTEKVPMGGQGGIKNSSDLTKEQKKALFGQSLVLGGSKNPVYDPSIARYPMGLYGKGRGSEVKTPKRDIYKGAKAVAATKPTTLAKRVTIKTTMAKKPK